MNTNGVATAKITKKLPAKKDAKPAIIHLTPKEDAPTPNVAGATPKKLQPTGDAPKVADAKAEKEAKRQQRQQKAETKQQPDLGPEYNEAAAEVARQRKRVDQLLEQKKRLVGEPSSELNAINEQIAATRKQLEDLIAKKRDVAALTGEAAQVAVELREARKQRNAALLRKKAAFDKATAQLETQAEPSDQGAGNAVPIANAVPVDGDASANDVPANAHADESAEGEQTTAEMGVTKPVSDGLSHCDSFDSDSSDSKQVDFEPVESSQAKAEIPVEAVTTLSSAAPEYHYPEND